MRVRSVNVLFAVLFLAGVAAAQAPSRPKAVSAAPQLHANLIQVMRGILLPNSNVVFFAQDQDPAAVKPDEHSAVSPNPLTSVYGGWTAVENSAMALVESANLLTIPGRVCANGRPAPVHTEHWAKSVQRLRDAGMSAYKAAKARSQDQILEVSEELTLACASCHDRYRDTPKEPVDRCV